MIPSASVGRHPQMPPLLTADLSLRASAHTGVAIRTSWQANSLPGITNQALIIQPDASGLFLIPTYDPSEQRDLQIHRVDLILRDAEIAFGYRPAGMPVNLHQHSLRRLCLGGVIAKGLPQPVAADSSFNFQRLISGIQDDGTVFAVLASAQRKRGRRERQFPGQLGIEKEAAVPNEMNRVSFCFYMTVLFSSSSCSL